MRKLTSLLFFLLLIFNLQAQELLRHTVYFASNKDVISPNEQKKLDEFIAQTDEYFIDNIEISGHTDSDASSEYNVDLSQRRVAIIQKQLLALKVNSTDISTNFYGETKPVDANTSSKGKQNNRRVEIVVELDLPVRDVSPPRVVVAEIDCSYDTTLIFPQGTEVTMNICDYFSIQDCFKFTEYNTGESIRNSEPEVTTMTADGAALISGGMFKIEMCKEVDVAVDIPRMVNPCDTTAEFKLWTSEGTAGTWSPIQGTIDRIRRGGRSFLRTVVSKTTSINLDCLPSTPPPKMIVKVPMGYKILKAKLSTNIPASLIYAKKISKRKATFESICPCSEPLIYLEVENPDGEVDTLNYTKLNDYDTHEAFGQCKRDEVVKKVLFFKVREKSMYRKYLIRKKNLDKKD